MTLDLPNSVPFDCVFPCGLGPNIVFNNIDLMVREQTDLIISRQKMAAALSLFYDVEATSKDAIAILCLKPSLDDASYKRRVSSLTTSFREFGVLSEGA